MIVSPSTILLLPGVGVFLPSGGSRFRFPTDFLENAGRASGGMPSCRCYNSGCLALVRCITRPWTLPA